MASSDHQEFLWASSRSRLGLILGPGSILMAVGASWLLVLLGFADDEKVFVLLVPTGLGFLLVCLHGASFIECVATVRVLRRRPLPWSVLALSIYWVLLLTGLGLLATGIAD